MNWRCESGSRDAYTGYHATIDHEGGLDAGDVSASNSEHSAAIAVVSATAIDSLPLSDSVLSVDSAIFVPVDSPSAKAISDEPVSVSYDGKLSLWLSQNHEDVFASVPSTGVVSLLSLVADIEVCLTKSDPSPLAVKDLLLDLSSQLDDFEPRSGTDNEFYTRLMHLKKRVHDHCREWYKLRSQVSKHIWNFDMTAIERQAQLDGTLRVLLKHKRTRSDLSLKHAEDAVLDFRRRSCQHAAAGAHTTQA